MEPIAIIDYGAGNLRSVQKAFHHLGHPAELVTDPDALEGAAAVVFPGQGAAPQAMRNLAAGGMDKAILRAVESGKPFFGVCLGLQLLLRHSEEEDTPCLGVVPGATRRLPAGLKLPHIGWNGVRPRRPHPLFEGVDGGAHFYFVHSYYGAPSDPDWTLATTEYGVDFPSVLAKGNVVATQFHPEKSGPDGLRLYDNFVKRFVLNGGG
ncbi:MAG: imidazole glycerol phosphate synthase subunit HisH [Chloroflexota bacterium]|nr:imidazole glycerol phosphate synthase subunit HisH [Chloroflexota bacterium]